MIKIPGLKTGTIDTINQTGNKRVKWVPKGDLMLIASEDAAAHFDLDKLPRQIASNAGAAEVKRFIRDKTAMPITKEEARIIVGFNVKDQPVWRSGQVYLMVFLLREEQLAAKKNTETSPAFTMFYAGLGAFPGTVKVSSERSAQFVFMNFGQDPDQFFEDMADLAQWVAEALLQESVLLELDRDGKTFYLDYVPGESFDWKLEEAEEYLEENAHRITEKVWRTE